MNEIFKLGVAITAQDLITSKLGTIIEQWEKMKEKFKSTAEIENSMKKLEDGIYKIQRGFAGIGIGFSIFKSIPINEARSFEKELGLLQAVSGATAKEFLELKEAAIQAGMKTQFSPDQAAAGLTALASAGMNAKQAMQALLPALDLASASAGKLSIDQASADIAATLNTFRRSAEEVSDTFTKMTQISSFQIQDLGAAWRGVNAIASSMNQTMEETALMLSAVKRAGFTTAESGEKVRQALEALASPSETAQKFMKELGVSAYDQNGKFKSLIQIFDEMEEAFNKKNLSEAQRNQYLSKILLSGGSSAYRALMSLSREERDDWMQKLESKQGATRKFAKTQQETYEGISVTLEGVLSTFKVVFGDAILPIMKTFKSILISVLSPMVEFFKEHPGLTKTIISLTALVGILAMLGGTLSAIIRLKNIFVAVTMISSNAQFAEAVSGSTLGKVMNLLTLGIFRKTAATELSTASTIRSTIATRLSAFWDNVSTISKNAGFLASLRFALAEGKRAIALGVSVAVTKLATAAQWAWNAAMMANPIGIVILAVLGLGAAIYGLIKLIKSMPTEIDKFHQKMMDSMSNEKNALEKKLEQLQKQEQMFLSLGDMGSEAYKKVQDKITETKKKLEDLNDVLQTSDGMLAQFVKTKEELEKKLETSKMKLDIAKQSGDVSAIKKAQEEYDELRKSLSHINEEIQKQKDLPSDLQAIVTELDKLRSAKAEIDINMPELKGSAGYKKIEEQIKKAEESLETLEMRLLQTASVSGSAFVKTFAEGIDKEFLTLYKKVAGNNAKLMNLFPQSDAKEGPFRNLSKSGSSLVVTFLSGIERAKSKLFSSLFNIMNDAKGFINFQTLGDIQFKLDNPIPLEKVLKSGEGIVKTLAQGVKNSANTLYDAIKVVFQKSWKLFTQSDAKEGPFSKMTYSGQSLIRTFSLGAESESPRLYTTLERSFGNANAIIQKENEPILKRSEPSQVSQTTNSSNVLNFEYFIKEFNLSGESSESNFNCISQHIT